MAINNVLLSFEKSARGHYPDLIETNAISQGLADYFNADLVPMVVISGTAGNNTLNGGSAADSISGLAGNDILNGLAGNDTLNGGDGNDTMDGGLGIDRMVGGLGNDKYYIDSYSDTIVEAAGGGIDTIVSYFNQYTLPDNVENLIGTNTQTMILVGNNIGNSITGGTYADTLIGGGGNDTLHGGGGNDAYFIETAGDSVVEGANAGYDFVNTTLPVYVMTANVEQVYDWSGTGAKVTGNTLDNHIQTQDGNDTIYGGAGNDQVYGGTANDSVFGGDGNDQLSGGAGNDTYDGGNGNDSFAEGGDTNGDGLDKMNGGAGNDTMHGGFKNDTLTGGTGHDAFVFSATLESNNIDTITDFNAVDDVMWLNNEATTFPGLPLGALAATAFKNIGPGGSAVDSSDRILYDQSTGQLYFDADGSGAGARIQFAVLSNHAIITAADFFVN